LTIAQTSLTTYIGILPNLKGNQMIVYKVIMDHPNCTNEEIADILGWKINSVTPRTKELRNAQIVRLSGTKKNAAGRKVQCMVVT